MVVFNMHIPVGYLKVAAEDIKEDDVIREIGIVVDHWITDEPEEWKTARGRSYMIESLVVVTEEWDGEFASTNFPLSAYIPVMQYANLSKESKTFVPKFFKERGDTVIFSSKK